MVSPVPKHLRSEAENEGISRHLREHVVDLVVDPDDGKDLAKISWHKAKYAPGLATALLKLAGTTSVSDPMAGTGRFFEETRLSGGAANDLDPRCVQRLREIAPDLNLAVSEGGAASFSLKREVAVFSPPYYPKADRKQPCAHDDETRGQAVGFRDSYGYNAPEFIGNPAGKDAILLYRNAMRGIYARLREIGHSRMILVTKNWTRLGVELRLDLDSILTAQEAGWRPVRRHGWEPPGSLWSRFNQTRGGGVNVEDVLVFDR